MADAQMIAQALAEIRKVIDTNQVDMKTFVKDNTQQALQQLTAAFDAKLESTVEKLQAQIDALVDRLGKIEASATDIADMSIEPTGSPRKRRAAPGSAAMRSSSAPTTDEKVHKLWIYGFPRKLLKPHLEVHYNATRSLLPQAAADHAKMSCGNMVNRYAIILPSAALCHDAVNTLRAANISWKDPRDNKVHEIRAGPDRTFHERLTVKALSSLWTQVRDHLKEKGLWKDDFKLGTTGPRGCLFLANSDDAAELFFVRTDSSSNQITISPGYGELTKIAIDHAAADAMVGVAVAAAASSY